MNYLELPIGKISEMGEILYAQRLRDLLEPAENGKYIVIDVEIGEYEVDADHLAASDRAAAKHPDALLYTKRIGLRTIGRIGALLVGGRVGH